MSQLMSCSLQSLNINFDDLDTKNFDDALSVLCPQIKLEFLNNKKNAKNYHDLFENHQKKQFHTICMKKLSPIEVF